MSAPLRVIPLWMRQSSRGRIARLSRTASGTIGAPVSMANMNPPFFSGSSS